MKLLNLIFVVVVVNYLNDKKMTGLPKVSTAERLEIDNYKIVDVNGSSTKPFYR